MRCCCSASPLPWGSRGLQVSNAWQGPASCVLVPLRPSAQPTIPLLPSLPPPQVGTQVGARGALRHRGRAGTAHRAVHPDRAALPRLQGQQRGLPGLGQQRCGGAEGLGGVGRARKGARREGFVAGPRPPASVCRATHCPAAASHAKMLTGWSTKEPLLPTSVFLPGVAKLRRLPLFPWLQASATRTPPSWWAPRKPPGSASRPATGWLPRRAATRSKHSGFWRHGVGFAAMPCRRARLRDSPRPACSAPGTTSLRASACLLALCRCADFFEFKAASR